MALAPGCRFVGGRAAAAPRFDARFDLLSRRRAPRRFCCRRCIAEQLEQSAYCGLSSSAAAASWCSDDGRRPIPTVTVAVTESYPA